MTPHASPKRRCPVSVRAEHGIAAARDLEQVFGQGTVTALPDGQLLERFVAARDEAAFSALVSRHGRMVLGVCRRALDTHPDVDDAFQATFLVLLRRASALRETGSLGPWLYGVAWRVARRARAGKARRRLEEQSAACHRPEWSEPDCPTDRRELHAIIDEEINRLPEKYRRPLVLCYMEGLTQEAAARQLEWKPGVLRGRLDRARLRLRGRLARRGLAPAVVLALAEVLESQTEAGVTQPLVDATVRTACRSMAVAGISESVAKGSAMILAGAVLRRQFIARALLVTALLAGCTGAFAVLGTSGIFASPVVSTQAPVPTLPLRGESISSTAQKIDFHIVNKDTGKPLPAVVLTVFVGAAQTVERMTGASGDITVDYPSPSPSRMHVLARKEGFVPMVVRLSHPVYDDELPSTFTLAMIRASKIGGVVKDEEGRPVVGASVSPLLVVGMDAPDSRATIRVDEVLTDAAGHWTCASVPAAPSGASFVGIRIRHPDFQTSKVSGYEFEAATSPNGTVVLTRGIAVTGQVVDRDGHPVPGARVGAGRDWFGSDPPIVDTDGNGRFRLAHIGPGETVITVQAKGYGPEVIELDARAGLPPLAFKLGPPRAIQGRVIDRNGKPLPRIRLAVVFWRGYRTLDWKAETGADGRFRWDDAPREEVWLNALGHGYFAVQNRVVRSTESETVIKLARTLRVTGTVVDSRTRKPINSYTLTPGTESQDGSITSWDRSRSRRTDNSHFEIRFPEPAEFGHLLRIEADGYALGISRSIADAERDARIDFELVPAAPLRR